MKLGSLGTGVCHLKAGFLGFQGSGKTWTAKELAIGVRQHFGLKGPIAMLDTEGGAQFIAPGIKEATGLELLGVQTRAMGDAVEFLAEAEKSGVSVVIIDSVTHLWEELRESFLSSINEARAKRNLPKRARLELADWGPIKDKWKQFSTAYLTSKVHAIICGRAGWEWDTEVDEEGKKSLMKTGIKMKAEGEMGHEPSLLVEMVRVQREEPGPDKKRVTIHRATVLKDRFDELDGMQADDPTFDFFRPHIERLSKGTDGGVKLDTTAKTKMEGGDEGDAEWAAERKRRTIYCEEIQGLLTAAWPGQSAGDKKAKVEVLHDVFGTYSWVAVESTKADALKEGVAKIRGVIAGRQMAERMELDSSAKGKKKVEVES